MNEQSKTNYKMSKEYTSLNSFLNYCRSCLISMVEYADKYTLVSERINYHSEQDRLALEKCCNSQQISAEQWLIENGYKDAAYSLYYKNLFFSLLVDFSNYFNASIDMAFARNINVAWALLRKPLQETLAYFEWLFVDKTELIELMLQGDIKKYEIMSKGLKEKRKKHINEIQSKMGKSKIDMYEFRYSYDDALTINGILQATNHLITTRPVLKTSPSGLNYIFMDDEIYSKNVGYYYTTIPYVMQYSLHIIMEIFAEIANLGTYTNLMNHINLMLKLFYAMDTPFNTVKELLGLNELDLYCPKCGRKLNSDKMWVNFTDNKFMCKYCVKRIDTQRYILDFENIKFCIEESNFHDFQQ